MSRDGSGTYSKPYADEVYDTVIEEGKYNDTINDLGNAITASMPRDGQAAPTANIPWGGYKITGYGTSEVPSARTEVPNIGQVQNSGFIWCGFAGGTANAIALTPSPAIAAYAAGQTFRWIAGDDANTDEMTIAVSGQATKAAHNDGSALAAGEHAAGKMYQGTYDGTAFQIQRVQISGSGDVAGPASSTDNVWPRFNGTGGKTLQNGTWAEDDSGNVTGGGTLNMGDRNLTRANFLDTSYGVNAIGDTSGANFAVDYTLGNVATATISTDAVTITFTNWPAGYGAVVLFLTNGGSQSITWTDAATAPADLTSSGVDKLLIESPDGGTTHYLTVLGRDL